VPRRIIRRRVPEEGRLPAEVGEAVREILPQVARDVVAAVVTEVPPYRDAFSGSMGLNIERAVDVALGGFLLVAEGQSPDTTVPATPSALEGAYELGRGEARSGRTSEALLAAYRIGARVAWRELSTAAVDAGLPPELLVEFAALVFAWIDEVSDASVAGHSDEMASAGRVRQRLLAELAEHLVAGASPETVDATAEQAGWEAPSTLTAVLLPASQVGPVMSQVSQATLEVTGLVDLPDVTVLLVPDAHARGRRALLRAVSSRGAVVGPAKPWRDARLSFERAVRAWRAALGPDTEAALVPLVLTADPDALADLRASVLAPLATLRPQVAEKLTETLRSWLLHQGRREQVAAELFVHPQTVRYRMTQLRELFGDSLNDPQMLLALTVALG
jgi:hypothetical protein